jgi:hypothetical protein
MQYLVEGARGPLPPSPEQAIALLVVPTKQMTPFALLCPPALDARFCENNEQVSGCRALEAYHSHVRLYQTQASELVACEQALVLGSSGQGRRRGR